MDAPTPPERERPTMSEIDLQSSGKAPRPNFTQPPQSRWRVDGDAQAPRHHIPKTIGNQNVTRDEGANAQSDRMRSLFMASTQMHTFRKPVPVNPIWMNFPKRCSTPVESEAEMRALLQYYASSSDVMVVRYWQEGCTACNALDKVYEWLCHETRKSYPGLKFYDVQQEKVPALVKGLVRFPQLKGFSGGQWTDIEFKPPEQHREMQYNAVQEEVRAARDRGQPLSAIQAEEMYFSATGPAMGAVTEENVIKFYNQVQSRMHNYWKQVAERRAWFFKKYIGNSQEALERAAEAERYSLFGEKAAAMPPGDKYSLTPDDLAASAPGETSGGGMPHHA